MPRQLSGLFGNAVRRLVLCAALGAAAVCASAREVVHLPVPYMRQPDNQTCLPTCLTMTLHWLGRSDLTTDTIQRLHRRTRYDRYNVPEIVKDYGLYAFPSWLEHAWTRETVEAELRAGRPVILGVDLGRAGHFILAVGYTDDGKVIVHDPWVEPGWVVDGGGASRTVDWSVLNWRNGIIVRPEPFPEPARAVSGKLVRIEAPGRLESGETTTVIVKVTNNGREPWPAEVWLAPVDAYTSPTTDRESRFAVLPGDGATTGAWISARRVAAPDRGNLAPGETASFAFSIRAPEVEKATVFRENFNLIDGSGRWFSEHWQTGPGNREIAMRLAVYPKRDWPPLPLVETAEDGRPSLDWETRSEAVEVLAADALTSAPPEGLTALRLPPGKERVNVAWVGDPRRSDYKVEAWIYCDYRPEAKPRGYERVGLFIRDNGHHAANSKGEVEIGGCLAMTYDSDDGKLRAGNIYSGGLEDFRPGRDTFYLRESGWHKFAIRCEGTTVTYELDGQPFHTANLRRLSRALPAGDCGLFVSSTFTDPADRHGVRFAGFCAVE